MFVPIFEKGGNRLLFCLSYFEAETEEEALRIGYGSLVECVLFDVSFLGEVIEVDPNNTPHARSNLGDVPVAIISGPLFDQTEGHGDVPTKGS